MQRGSAACSGVYCSGVVIARQATARTAVWRGRLTEETMPKPTQAHGASPTCCDREHGRRHATQRSTTDGTGSTVDTLIAKSRLINARMLFPVAPRVHLIKVAVAEGVR
jgi:hypothetical protein